MSRVGIVGCGNIAPVYVRTLRELGWVEVAGFTDVSHERAEAFASRYGGVPMDLEQLLADPTIDAVVNLTPAQFHVPVTRAILESGKAAFSEKPLGIELSDGEELVALAAAKGVRLGCAPDTFLGVGLQTARSVIDRGLIGEPLAANGFMMSFGPEWWHPNPEIFYGSGAGPLFDVGPYYLSALTFLLGPAVAVSGAARIGIEERVIHARGRVGDTFRATVPTHVSSLIEFASGALGTLVTSFDVKASRYRNLEIYGTEGTLSVPDPNTFGGPVSIRGVINDEWREIPTPAPHIPQQRGIGLADMLSATSAGRPHRASAEQALHVLDLMTGAIASADSGHRHQLTTTCGRSAPLRFDRPANTFD